MRERYRKLREVIRAMPTKEATSMVQAFRLPSEEEAAVILMDIRKMSRIQAGDAMGLSPDAVRNRRASAYSRMCAEIEDMEKSCS